jgi:hypothetical protein
MAHEQLKNSALPRALSDVVGDLADLFQKEMRLARAELADKLSSKVQAGIWMSAAGVFALIAGLLVIQAIVFGIASFGIPLHWSCLIVAAVMAAAGALAYYKGRAEAQEELTPTRTIRQIKEDATTVKEQLK